MGPATVWWREDNNVRMRIRDEWLIFRMLQYLSRRGCQQSPEGQLISGHCATKREAELCTMRGECCAYAQRIGRDETALLAISWQYTPHLLVNAVIGPSLVHNDLMIVSTLHIKLPDWIEIFETWWSIRGLRSGPVISYDRLTTWAKHFSILTR